MKFNREHFRKIIFSNFRRRLTQQQCIDVINSIFGNEASSGSSVYWWYDEFNRGRSSLQDEFRGARPKSVVIPETIDAVRQLILQNRHVFYREIETSLGITFNIEWTFECQKNWFALDPAQFVNRTKKSVNQSDKSDSTINACKSL